MELIWDILIVAKKKTSCHQVFKKSILYCNYGSKAPDTY